jgi:hypothetical protein
MNDGSKVQVLARREGIELVRYRNGARELRRTGQPFDSMDAAFAALATIRR